MAREIKNVAASVRARLLELSRSTGRDFQLVLTNYALERLLYRLSVSKHKKRFILKGALLFTVWLDDPFRPTRDLDLLGSGSAEANAVANIFREILALMLAEPRQPIRRSRQNGAKKLSPGHFPETKAIVGLERRDKVIKARTLPSVIEPRGTQIGQCAVAPVSQSLQQAPVPRQFIAPGFSHVGEAPI